MAAAGLFGEDVPHGFRYAPGFVDVAAEFAPAQTGVSMARFLREPRG